MTEAIRQAIQHSQTSMRILAQRHGINPKTVAKWKKRVRIALVENEQRIRQAARNIRKFFDNEDQMLHNVAPMARRG